MQFTSILDAFFFLIELIQRIRNNNNNNSKRSKN